MGKPTNKHVNISLSDAEQMAGDLNELVVSLDRILSRIGTGGADPQILLRYLRERNVCKRLAWQRETVFRSLEEVVGTLRAEEIAEGAYFYTD